MQVRQQAHGLHDRRVAAHGTKPAAVLFGLFGLAGRDHFGGGRVAAVGVSVKALEGDLVGLAVCGSPRLLLFCSVSLGPAPCLAIGFGLWYNFGIV